MSYSIWGCGNCHFSITVMRVGRGLFEDPRCPYCFQPLRRETPSSHIRPVLTASSKIAQTEKGQLIAKIKT